MGVGVSYEGWHTLWFGAHVAASRRVLPTPPRFLGAGCRVQGAGCRVQGVGCRVQGVGCLVCADCRVCAEFKLFPLVKEHLRLTVFLLQGPRRGVFLMSEVPLYLLLAEVEEQLLPSALNRHK